MTDDGINMQSHEMLESAKGCMKDMLEHYYTSTTSAISLNYTVVWEPQP
jgi:hypothetical protein